MQKIITTIYLALVLTCSICSAGCADPGAEDSSPSDGEGESSSEDETPDEKTAHQIWNTVLSEGFIPIEIHFEHVFHNPVNKQFPFVDCCVRKVRPRISTLVGLIQQCAGVICVVSGNFHTALSVLSPDRIFFLEKHFKLASFTKLNIPKTSIMPNEFNPDNLKVWLNLLEGM